MGDEWPVLSMMTQLTSLNLSLNDLGAAGAASLAPALSMMTQMTSLDLSRNHFGAAEAASLAPALSMMTQMTSLDLSRRLTSTDSVPLVDVRYLLCIYWP
jgi:hypothetical protein